MQAGCRATVAPLGSGDDVCLWPCVIAGRAAGPFDLASFVIAWVLHALHFVCPTSPHVTLYIPPYRKWQGTVELHRVHWFAEITNKARRRKRRGEER